MLRATSAARGDEMLIVHMGSMGDTLYNGKETEVTQKLHQARRGSLTGSLGRAFDFCPEKDHFVCWPGGAS